MKKRMHILYVIMTVMLVTPAGALKSEFILAGEASFNLALSPDGRYLYVADNGNDRIAVLDPDTLKVIGVDYKLLGTIGTGKPGKDPGQLNTPEGVATTRQGRVDFRYVQQSHRPLSDN